MSRLFITIGISIVIGCVGDIQSVTKSVCSGLKLPAVAITSQGSGLDSFVGTNVLQEILYDESCNFDMDCFTAYMWKIMSGVLSAGVGIVIAILVLVIFLIFSPCLGSRRWRQWKGWKRLKEYHYAHDFDDRMGRVIVGLFFLVGLGTLASIIIMSVNKVQMDQQLDIALCEALQFGNETINGGGSVVFEDNQGYVVDAAFPGFANAAALITDLTEVLSPNGTLVAKLEDFINVTGDIEEQLVYLQSILLNLNDVMKYNYLVNYHECVFSRNFSYYPTDAWPNNPLNPSMTSVNDSFAGLLVEVRAQLKPYVDNSFAELYVTLSEMNSSMNSTIETVNSYVNDFLVDNVDNIYQFSDYVDIVIIVVLCITAIPLLLTVYVVRVGLYKSQRHGDYNDPSTPPTSPAVASIPMGITLLYTFLVFLISGLFLISAWFLASGCLVAEDFSSAVSKLSFRFGSADVAQRVSAITQECLTLNSPGDILSAITIDADSTARDKINALTELSGEFAVVQKTVSAGGVNTNLTTNTFLNNFSKYFASIGDLYLILSDTKVSSLDPNPSYAPNPSAAIFSSNYALGVVVWNYTVDSSPTCPDRIVLSAQTPTGVQSFLTNYTSNSAGTGWIIPGFNSMNNTLTSHGVNTGVVGTCPGSTYPSNDLNPWGNLVSLKQGVLMKTDYRCDVPSTYLNAAGYWQRNATAVTCDASQESTYIRNYGAQFLTQAGVVDNIVAENWSYLIDELWSIIFDDLMAPAQLLGETLNCQFVSARWNAMRVATCNEYTPNLISLGKLMFSLGFFGIFVLIVQIIVWRHLKDNYCLWTDAVVHKRKGGAPRQMSSFTPFKISTMFSSVFNGSIFKSRDHPNEVVHDNRETENTDNPVTQTVDAQNADNQAVDDRSSTRAEVLRLDLATGTRLSRRSSVSSEPARI